MRTLWVLSYACFVVSIVLVMVPTLFACGPAPETTATGEKPALETSEPSEEDVAIFLDKNLEQAIRERIRKPEGSIHIADLEKLTSLTISLVFEQLSDLTGLEHCINLTKLKLAKNGISDIAPLAPLTNLTELSLELNEVNDISPLASLTNLTWLQLGGNNISEISPLASLVNLTFLDIGSNEVSDISPLAYLTELATLDLSSNEISDISPLASLVNLRSVKLWANPLSTQSVDIIIPQLEEKGVDVQY